MYFIKKISYLATAGVASIRYDLPEFIPPEMCMASDLSSYGGETLAGTIMYPSVYTSYGLSHRDLFQVIIFKYF